MLLNSKDKEVTRLMQVGSTEIHEVESTKLLGIMIDNDQNWTSHFWEKTGLLQSLNQRLFAIIRIAKG